MKLPALALALALTASAQTTAPPEAAQPVRNYHLSYATSQQDQNEVLTALRNMLPASTRIYLVPGHNEILVTGAPEAFRVVEEILPKLDVPAKLYRLTYTFTETEGGKRIGVQHYSMMLAAGQRLQMKEGSRVPLIVSSTPTTPGKPSGDRTYLDVGLNFDSTIEPYGPTGARLRSKIERSSLAEEKSGLGPEDPLIRQTLTEGTTILAEGKPLPLASIDVIGSARHLEVEALLEVVR